VGGPLVAAPVPLAGFSFMEKYQSPAITTTHAPMSILRTSLLISVSSFRPNHPEDKGSSLAE
jgi:hypothetical protein